MSASDKTRQKITRTGAEWQKLLAPAQYHVARQHGTERAFTGPYWNEKAAALRYELFSICARSSAIEPKRTVPCGSWASMEPSA